ncbi:SDR family NAD(P)-dependent oxidoreductase [Nocardia sp. NPDC051052]|uniref:SDR family NAD(P)-dependent oxidoreductase n=1 Tax=Nocardia sp. NPDC051052 TaxID=3364322 RepID=UPI0037BCA03E
MAWGLAGSDHPLVGAVVHSPDSGGVTVTGRLSVDAHRWLADHAVSDVVLVPGTGFVELVMRAADEVGCVVLRELTLLAPLALPASGGVQVQVVVAGVGEQGERAVAVYARPEAERSHPGSGADWTLHAEGVVSSGGNVFGAELPAMSAELAQWPPVGAVGVDLAGLYDRLADAGYRYGPSFRGLRSVWRRGADLFVEAALPEPGAEVARYRLHPALLDAVLHGMAAAAETEVDRGGQGPRLPFAWQDVVLHAVGATYLRAHIAPSAGDDSASGAVRIHAVDESGQPVVTAGSLTTRPMRPIAAMTDRLLGVQWNGQATSPRAQSISESVSFIGIESSLDLADPPRDLPSAVVFDMRRIGAADAEVAVVERVHAVAATALAVVQAWLGDSRFGEGRLVVLTAGAVSVAGERVSDLAGAAVWGLVRSAQSEDPGRIVLADVDDAGDVGGLVGGILASGEPQVAVRGGQLHVARLTRLSVAAGVPVPVLSGSVVVTGGTGGLGAIVARHLVVAHGVTSLVLGSRRGLDAAGVADLVEELTGLGAMVRVVACDVSTRVGVDTLLGAVPVELPLVGVVHAAGVLDDGVIAALTPRRLDAVLAAKADAAWYLHEATRDVDLALFVLYSSVAGVLGGAGQGNYAAANSFLDALAEFRRAEGLVAVSIAWGLWDSGSGMGARLRDEDTIRLSRDGVSGMSVEQGLVWFDAALIADRATVTATHLDLAALRRTTTVPAILRELEPRNARPTSTAMAKRSLPEQLQGLNTTDREKLVVEYIHRAAAKVLDYPTADSIGQNLASAGFDSLTAIEMRNMLNAVTGLRLPAMVVFDIPETAELARHILDALPRSLAPAPGITPEAHGRSSEATTPFAAEDSIVALYKQAIGSGKLSIADDLLRSASSLRPVFDIAQRDSGVLKGVTWSSNGPLPYLVFICTPVFTGGVHQHAHIARAFRGRRPVLSIPLSGFAADQPLPANAEIAIEAVSAAVLAAVGAEPFVLAGYSSGGNLAYAAAQHLLENGCATVRGVVLLDSFKLSGEGQTDLPVEQLPQQMLTKESSFGDFSSARLTAMFSWCDLLPELYSGDLDTEVLFVQCGKPVLYNVDHETGRREGAIAQPWSPTHRVVTVSEDHFSVVIDGSVGVSNVIEGWMEETL